MWEKHELFVLLINYIEIPFEVNFLKTFQKPLTLAEEQYYLKQYQNGDSQAKDILIERNLRLVAHVVKKYQGLDEDLDDLISIGTIGLIKAVGTFCADRGIKLATYASRCIENEILMYIRKTGNQKVEISLDEPLNVDWDGNELLLSDILSGDDDSVSRNLEECEERAAVKEAISNLPPRERTIIELRFGIGGKKEHTQKEVADMLGISQSYISRLEKRIISELHGSIAAKL